MLLRNILATATLMFVPGCKKKLWQQKECEIYMHKPLCIKPLSEYTEYLTESCNMIVNVGRVKLETVHQK